MKIIATADVEYTIDVSTNVLTLYALSQKGRDFLSDFYPNRDGSVSLNVVDNIFPDLESFGLKLKEKKPN